MKKPKRGALRTHEIKPTDPSYRPLINVGGKIVQGPRTNGIKIGKLVKSARHPANLAQAKNNIHKLLMGRRLPVKIV